MTITLWHFDAGSGRRPPHHVYACHRARRHGRRPSHSRQIAAAQRTRDQCQKGTHAVQQRTLTDARPPMLNILARRRRGFRSGLVSARSTTASAARPIASAENTPASSLSAVTLQRAPHAGRGRGILAANDDLAFLRWSVGSCSYRPMSGYAVNQDPRYTRCNDNKTCDLKRDRDWGHVHVATPHLILPDRSVGQSPLPRRPSNVSQAMLRL